MMMMNARGRLPDINPEGRKGAPLLLVLLLAIAAVSVGIWLL